MLRRWSGIDWPATGPQPPGCKRFGALTPLEFRRAPGAQAPRRHRARERQVVADEGTGAGYDLDGQAVNRWRRSRVDLMEPAAEILENRGG